MSDTRMIDAIAFDAFGTLLDTVSATRRHAARVGAHWEAFSTLWRTKQFEYTWVRSLVAGQHKDFARLVDDALQYAADAHGLADTALLAELRASFDTLEAFPDVEPGLKALRAKDIGRAILSNGTPSMLTHQARTAGLEPLLDHVLSVEEVGVFKPDARVYALAVERLRVPAHRLGFVSSNPWDVFGAHVFGLRAYWINRGSRPDEYGLRGVVQELGSLSELVGHPDLG